MKCVLRLKDAEKKLSRANKDYWVFSGVTIDAELYELIGVRFTNQFIDEADFKVICDCIKANMDCMADIEFNFFQNDYGDFSVSFRVHNILPVTPKANNKEGVK